MPLTNIGRDILTKAIVGASATLFDSTHACIGVGDDSSAFDPAQTDLQASTNNVRKAVDGGFPTQVGNQLTFQATFDTSDANFAWGEFGVFNSLSGGDMLTRKVETIGSGPKSSSEIWQLTVVLTVTAS